MLNAASLSSALEAASFTGFAKLPCRWKICKLKPLKKFISHTSAPSNIAQYLMIEYASKLYCLR